MSYKKPKFISYYCEKCGIELHSKGTLCPDCAREERNFYKKSKNKSEDPYLEDSGKSGKHSKRR